MSSTVDLKRGKLTERIGDAEGTHLPNKTTKNKELSTQIEEKRVLLERLVKNVSKSKTDMEALERDVSDLEGRKHEYMSSMKSHNSTIDKNTEERDSIETENSALKKEMAIWKAQVHREEKKLRELTAKAQKKEEEHDKSTKNEDLQRQANTKQKDGSETAGGEKELLGTSKNRQMTKETVDRFEETKHSSHHPHRQSTEKRVISENEATVQGTSHGSNHEQDEYAITQEKLNDIDNSIDHNEKMWITLQDQISRAELDLTELKAWDHQFVPSSRSVDSIKNSTGRGSWTKSRTSSKSRKIRRPVAEDGLRETKQLIHSRERMTTSNEDLSHENSSDGETITDMVTKSKLILTENENSEISRSAARIQSISRATNELRSRRTKSRSHIDSRAADTNSLRNEVARLIEEKIRLENRREQVTHELQKTSLEIQSHRRNFSAVQKKAEMEQQQRMSERAQQEEARREQAAHFANLTEALEVENNHLQEQLHNITKDLGIIGLTKTELFHKLQNVTYWQKKVNSKEHRYVEENLLSLKNKARSCEEELKALMVVLEEARSRNRVVKDDLSVVKPYFSEQCDYDALIEYEKELDKRIREQSSLESSRQWKKDGDLVLD